MPVGNNVLFYLVGNMSIKKMSIGNMNIGNMVIGKKSWQQHVGEIDPRTCFVDDYDMTTYVCTFETIHKGNSEILE